jgi:hypothetical protein
MTFIKGQTAWNKGKPMTEETKAKLTAKLTGRQAWNKGIAWSEEVKAKISASKKKSFIKE